MTTLGTGQGALQLPHKEVWGQTDVRRCSPGSEHLPGTRPLSRCSCLGLLGAGQKRGCLGEGVSGLRPRHSGKGREQAEPPPLLHSPPIRLSSRSRYFRHMCRPFSSSLRTGGRKTAGQSTGRDFEEDPAPGEAGRNLTCVKSCSRPPLSLTEGDRGSQGWTWASLSPGSPRCGARPGGSEETPGHPAD